MRVVFALVLLVALVAAIWYVGGDAAPSGPAPSDPGEVAAWTGSAACAECHPDLHARWAKTAHALSIRPYAADVVKKPFDGEIFVARDKDHRLGPGGQMTCEGPGGKQGTFEVEMVIGLRRVQMFTTTLDDGRIQVLPVFLEVPVKRWFDYTDFIFGGPNTFEVPPDSPYSWYGPHRNFSSRCGRCHMVDYEIGYDADTGRYETTWKEPIIGCESCHGRGGEHARFHREQRTGTDPIVNPSKLTSERADQVCGQCHAESYMVKPGFRPGDDLFAHFDVAGLEDEKHLFPDGRARELIHALVQSMESKCGVETRCTTCHDPHGRGTPGDLYRPLLDDRTCTQCHEEIGAALEEHTHHKAESAGSRCVNCHMPPLVIEGGHGRVRDHTISIPSMRNTRELGLPNACRSCHLDQYPGWEYESFAKWYPQADERNHRVPLAAAFAAARTGKPDGVRPFLQHENPIYRAGAARLLARSDADLRPLLADAHPLVRRAAIDGVAARHPAALEPLLDHGNTVLRREAAMALASRAEKERFDFIRARPELRARVRAVLEECARLRPDDADLHFTLAKLLEIDGRRGEALAAYNRYTLLRPWDKAARAHADRLR